MTQLTPTTPTEADRSKTADPWIL